MTRFQFKQTTAIAPGMVGLNALPQYLKAQLPNLKVAQQLFPKGFQGKGRSGQLGGFKGNKNSAAAAPSGHLSSAYPTALPSVPEDSTRALSGRPPG